MMDVQVQVNQAQMRRINRLLLRYPQQMPRLLTRAVNRAAMGARHRAAVEIKQDLPLQLSYIKRAIAIRKAMFQTLEARLYVSRERIPLSRYVFRPRQLKKGVSYRMRAGEGRTFIPRAFIARVRHPTKGGDHVGVFLRKKEAGGDKLVPRNPIRQLFGPSIGHVYENAGTILGRHVAGSIEQLEREIDGQIAAFLIRN